MQGVFAVAQGSGVQGVACRAAATSLQYLACFGVIVASRTHGKIYNRRIVCNDISSNIIDMISAPRKLRAVQPVRDFHTFQVVECAVFLKMSVKLGPRHVPDPCRHCADT